MSKCEWCKRELCEDFLVVRDDNGSKVCEDCYDHYLGELEYASREDERVNND